jgi:hypothetical protein
MPIYFSCGSCQTPFRTRDDNAGKKVKCDACGVVVVIPTLTAKSGRSSGSFARPSTRVVEKSDSRTPVRNSNSGTPTATREAGRTKVKERLLIPALLMKFCSVVILVICGVILFGFLVNALFGNFRFNELGNLGWVLAGGVLSFINFVGMSAVLELRDYNAAVAGCVAGLLQMICLCFPQALLALIVLVVLVHPGVKDCFD